MSRIMLIVLVFASACLTWSYATSNSIEPPPITGDLCPVKELKGEKGDPGSIGPAGKDGLPGKAGVKGDQGEKGEQGENGKVGAKGSKGSKGIPGDDGKSGVKGEMGKEGKCDEQCGNITELREKLTALESNYTEELAGLKQQLAYLMSWVHPLGSKENPAVSCKDILKRDKKAPSGPYYIKVKDTNLPGNAQEVYCIMTRSGSCPAGITQVLKIDGRKDSFKYSSPLWTNKEMFTPENGKKGCDYSQTKLATYWSTPFESICVRMRPCVNGFGWNRWTGRSGRSQTKCTSWTQSLKIDLKGKSLYDLIAPGKYTKTNLNIQSDWKGLLSGSGCASLQTKCTKQGINVYTKTSAARIGVLGDEVANCHNPDSYIGFGTQGSSCGRNPRTSCGNEAGCGADQGNRRTQAMGYIYVY